MDTKACRAFAVLTISLIAISASANTTNSVSFEQPFDGMSNGESIIGTNGWYGAESTYAVATNEATNPYIVLNTDGKTITNRFYEIDPANSNVYFDILLKPTRWPDDAYTNQFVGTDIELGLVVNSNGHLVVYHAFDLLATPAAVFTEIPYVTLSTTEWTRVTITQSNLMGTAVSMIRLNEGDPLTNASAYTPAPAYGGPWFANADNALTSDGFKLSSVSFSGTGFFDDFAVTYTDPLVLRYLIATYIYPTEYASWVSVTPSSSFKVLPGSNTAVVINVSNFWDVTSMSTNSTAISITQTVNLYTVSGAYSIRVDIAAQTTTSVAGVDVPRWWLDDYPLDSDDPDGNLDNDALDNWQEWLVSTDPAVSNEFEITKHYLTNGNAGVVEWVSTAVDPSLPPFSMLRTTNLLAPGGGWSNVANHTRPTGGGTNIWVDPTPPAGGIPAFYRISATN